MLNPSEEFLRDQLGKHELPVDTDTIWNNIATDLPQRKKKRRLLLWWWWGGIIGLLSLGGAFYYYFTPTQTVISTTATNPPATTTLDSAVEVCPPTTFADVKMNGVTVKNTEVRTATISASTPPTAPPTAVKTSVAAAEVSIPSTTIDTPRPVESVAPLSALTLPFSIATAPVTSLPIVTEQRTSRPKKRIKRKRKRWSTVLDGYTGLGYSLKQLSVIERDVLPWLEHRRATETELETLHVGLDVRRLHRRGFFWQVGLQYQRITERFVFQEARTEPQEVEQITSVTVDALNQVVTTSSQTAPAVQQTTIDKRIYNHLHRFELPFGLGYRYRLRKWRVELGGGLQLNIFNTASGQIVRNPSGFTSLENVIRTGSAGLSLWADARFLRVITPQLTVFLAPHVAQQLGNLADESYGLRQRYGTGGVKFGIRMRL